MNISNRADEIKKEIGGWVCEGEDPIDLDSLATYLAKLENRIKKLSVAKERKESK